MKRFFMLAIIFAVVLSSSAFADETVTKIGLLTKSDAEEARFNSDVSLKDKWSVSSNGNEKKEFKYYNSLSTMLLALNADEIDEIDVPKVVAEYVIAQNPDYKISCVNCVTTTYFAFGFKNDNSALCQKFNQALSEMRKDDALRKLQEEYLLNPGKNAPKPVKFETFPDSETVKIAVTGDVPPIDYVAADGTVAGFNAAMLAEIGRRLKINIKIISIETAAKVAVLVSGRADGVFWFMTNNFDLPESVIASDPYYTFDEFLHVRKK